jgi:SAM domain (Sterile alpha motif)
MSDKTCWHIPLVGEQLQGVRATARLATQGSVPILSGMQPPSGGGAEMASAAQPQPPPQPQPQLQPAIDLLSVPSRATARRTESAEQQVSSQSDDTAGGTSSCSTAAVFQQPPWQPQQADHHVTHSPAGANGVHGSKAGPQQKHYDWLSGTATAHLSKKEQRWQQQLQMPYDQWTSAQVACLSAYIHLQADDFYALACVSRRCRVVPLLQVADWVSNIGMDQYRRSFVHHAIDGMLLGQLTSEQLKVWCLAALLPTAGCSKHALWWCSYTV